MTGSFFGEAVKQARDGMNIPVATSFDGIIERALGLDRPLHVLATAPDSATLLSAELEREATRRSSSRSSRWSGASHKARRCAPGQSSARPARGWRDCAI